MCDRYQHASCALLRRATGGEMSRSRHKKVKGRRGIKENVVAALDSTAGSVTISLRISGEPGLVSASSDSNDHRHLSTCLADKASTVLNYVE